MMKNFLGVKSDRNFVQIWHNAQDHTYTPPEAKNITIDM